SPIRPFDLDALRFAQVFQARVVDVVQADLAADEPEHGDEIDAPDACADDCDCRLRIVAFQCCLQSFDPVARCTSAAIKRLSVAACMQACASVPTAKTSNPTLIWHSRCPASYAPTA